MEALINWVTQIIMFVLLATVIDLLIPKSAMKKYINLVVGLLLMLILLKPAFALFQLDIEREVINSFSNFTAERENDKKIESLIDFQKKEIESTQHAYILEQMAVQLKEIAEVPMKEEFELMIAHIDFSFIEGEEMSANTLDEVIVYVKEMDREGEINAVEEVVIDTEKQNGKVTRKVDHQPVEELLRRVWELDEQQITIVEEGGTF